MSSEKSSIRLTPRQRLALQRATRQRGKGRVALRATVILLSAQGQSAASIARTLGLTTRTVHECRRRWRQWRLRGLEDAPRSGRPRRVESTYLRLLLRTVESDPRQLNFAFTRWTRSRLAEYLRQRTGIAISPDWVGRLLRQHGYVWRRAKPTTRNLREEGEKTTRRPSPQGPAHSQYPSGSQLRVVVHGVRFDLLPVTRAMWRRRGRRLLLHTPGKNVRVAVCGALRYPNGPFLFSHGPTSVDTDLFIILLNKLVRRARRTGRC